MVRRELRAALRHPDTARCAQGAVMVAQELLRAQARQGGLARTAAAHADGALVAVSALVGRLLPGLGNPVSRSPHEPSPAGSPPSGAGATATAAYAPLDHDDLDRALDGPVVPPAARPQDSKREPAPEAGAVASTAQANAASSKPRSTPEAAAPTLDPRAGLVQEGEKVATELAGQERRVPSSRLGRVVGFGQLGLGLAFGSIGSVLSGGSAGPRSSASDEDPTATQRRRSARDVILSEANSDRIAGTLCRMRGAALKLGQMLSIQDESVLPPQLSAALERVRQSADIMPAQQLNEVMAAELGLNWRDLFEQFNDRPFAAASLGQVHQAVMHGSRTPVAVKVQFPGVAQSIDSDLANLRRLAAVTGIFPRGLHIDRIIEVMKDELSEECDYEGEARHQTRFRELLGDETNSFFVPAVIPEASTARVLTTELARGIPIDKVATTMSQEVRNGIGRKLLRLCLRELFEFRYMQTDPNFSNYLYDGKLDRIVLLDFGATRAYGREFVDDYMELVWAASQSDRTAILEHSIKLGFLTGNESQEMINAHIEAGLEVGRPFQHSRPFDFRASRINNQIGKHGDTFMKDRLVPPPREVYSLHRKLSGAYMTCIRIGAVFPCRDMLEEAYSKYSKQPQKQQQQQLQ
mmetsp:Transcript_2659/g.8050  ORF Transcript_2659/g.8050 Transcript_2659/m.8050 type:complete len:638 (-) Transcript_2659:38-1951(-)